MSTSVVQTFIRVKPKKKKKLKPFMIHTNKKKSQKKEAK